MNTQQVYKIGDCLKLLRELPNESINLVVTDPPYNENYDYRTQKFTDYREDYYEFLENVLIECHRVLKPNGAIFLKHSSRQINKIFPLMDKIFNFKSFIIWISNSMAHPLDNFDSYYEPIFYYTKTKDDYVFNKKAELRKKPPNYWSGNGTPFVGLVPNVWYDIKKISAGCLSIVEGGSRDNEKIHPCSMPVRLAERAIKFTTHEGDTVLDPFLGSGTLLEACRNTNRNGIGFEINEENIEQIEERYKRKTPKLETWFLEKGDA